MNSLVRRSLGALLLLLAPSEILAQVGTPNNTAGNLGAAARLTVGQQAVVQVLMNSGWQGWFVTTLRVGRSYCASVTTSQMSFLQSPVSMLPGNPVVAVFQGDAATVVASNNDTTSEPDSVFQARACFIWPTGASTTAFIEATQTNANQSFYDVRIIETTMFCPWFFIAGDYNAFTLIRNTTSAAVNFTVNWRDSTGAIVGTTAGAVAANGNVALNARDFVNHVTTVSGSIEIAHNGSEDALKASTTTLSPTTGLSFDAMFEQRRSQ